MKVVALLLLTVTFVAATLMPSWDHTRLKTIRSHIPFKKHMLYTYAYETIMKVANPVVPDQLVAIKLNALVHLRFVPTRLGFFKVRMTITQQTLKNVVVNPNVTPVPIETVIPFVTELKQQLSRAVIFSYKNGKVISIFHHSKEHLWSVNIKRGIINMFSVDFLGRDKTTKDNTMFVKTEKTIQGICDCVYTMENTRPFLNVSKTIDVTTCKTSLDQIFSSITPEVTLTKPASPLKSLTTVDIEILRLKSNFKIIRSTVTGTTMLFPLGETKQPIKAVATQTLRLVKEMVSRSWVEIPKWTPKPLMMELPKETLNLKRFSSKEVLELVTLVKDTLVTLKAKMDDVSSPFTKESATMVMELVHTLRVCSMNELKMIWEKCIIMEPAVRDIFVRVFSLIKTEDSMKVFWNKIKLLPTPITDVLIKEYLFMLSTSSVVDRSMVQHIDEICLIPVIKDNKELYHQCFVTAVILRNVFCQYNPCTKKDSKMINMLIPILRKPSFMQLSEEYMLKHLEVVELAALPALLPQLLTIIKSEDIPLFVRVRAVLALKPIVPKVTRLSIITNPLIKMFRMTTLPEELRLSIFAVIMERPTPSIIYACVRHLTIEPSMTVRKFVFDTLLALTTPELPLPVHVKQVVRSAVNFIRLRRLIPVNLQWIRQHFIKVLKPLPSSTLELLFKNQLHYTKSSIVPKHMLTKLDIKIFGRYLNLIDMEIKTEGVQQLLSKLMGIIPKTAPSKIDEPELKLFTTLKLFGKQWLSLYKTIEAKPNESLMTKVLPKKYVTWSHLAQAINDGLTFETKQTVMPIEFIARIPTCVGIPLVYNLSTIMMYHMESLIKTKTPSLLDIPRVLFTKEDITVTAIHKQRTILMLGGILSIETPLVRVGIHHKKTLNITLDTKAILNVNMETMKFNEELHLPTLPEIMTTESETEMFIRYLTPTKTIVYKRIPTLINHVLPRVHILNNVQLKPEEINSTVHLKINRKYLSILYGKLVVSTTPEEWVIISCPTNERIISLYIPKLGFLSVDPITQEFTFSMKERAYFFMDTLTDGLLSLKTLVPTKVTSLPLNLDSHIKPVVECVRLLREQGIVTKEMERVERMLNEDFVSNAVEVMYFTLRKQKTPVLTEQPVKLPIVIETVVSPYDQIKRVVVERSLCLNELPLCFHGIVPKTPTMNIDTLFLPMWIKVVLPTEIKKIATNISSIVTDTKTVITTKIGLIGKLAEKKIHLSLFHNTVDSKIEFTIRRFTKEVPEEFLFCMNVKYPKDSFVASISIHPQCETKLIEVYTEKHELMPKTYPRYTLDFNWIVRIDMLPTTKRELLLSLHKSYVLPYLQSSFMLPAHVLPRVFTETPLRIMESLDINYSEIINGSIRIFLPTPTFAHVTIKTPMKLFVYKINLPFPLESIPIGSEKLPLIPQLLNALIKPVCIYRLDTIITFDQLRHKFEHLNKEHVLMETRKSSLLPRLMVTVKEMKTLRHVRIVLGKSEILILPSEWNSLPEIMINSVPVAISNIPFLKKMNLQIIWIPELKNLVIRHIKLGLELKLIASRTIHLRASPLLFGDVRGLCGNMNMRQEDEFETPEKVIVKDPMVFGLSWMLLPKSCLTQEKCVMEPFERKECGYYGIKQKECETKGCCWKPLTKESEAPWCFHPTTECKLLKEFRVIKSSCRPMIKLPVCPPKCQPLKTIRLTNVPMKCPRYEPTTLKTIIVPIECRC